MSSPPSLPVPVPVPSLDLLSFSPSPCSACHVVCSSSSDRGRILVAARSLEPGELILREYAVLSASWDEFRCIECSEPHPPSGCALVRSRYTGPVCKAMRKVERRLADIEGIDEIDRARCLIQCLNEYRQRGSSDGGFLRSLLSLSGVNIDRCRSAIAEARQLPIVRQSGLFPAGLTNDDAARLLAILNTNSHQLTEVEGSGIFLRAALAEHSCAPNANFTTRGTELSMFAINRIEAGTSVTIDYGNFYYSQPTDKRRAALMSSHQFHCSCQLCNGQLIDKCRAFKCSAANCGGLVYGRGSTLAPCSVCGLSVASDIARLLSVESALDRLTIDYREPNDEDSFEDSEDEDYIDFSSPAFSFDRPPERGQRPNDDRDIELPASQEPLNIGDQRFDALPEDAETAEVLAYADRLLAATPLHRSHWLLFDLFDRIGRELSAEASRSSLVQAEKIFRDQLNCLRAVIQTEFHEELANAMDCLAQVLIAQGRIADASQVFTEAAKISAVTTGADSPATQQLRELSLHTPRNALALQSFYSNFRAAVAEAEYRAREDGVEVLDKSLEQANEDEQQEHKQQKQKQKQTKQNKNSKGKNK